MEEIGLNNMENELVFPSKHYMPKEITQQSEFLKKYPKYDGRNTVIAIIDSGVDPSLPGLQTTTTGLPKIIDCLDLTGAGDVDTSTIKKVDENGILIGLTERKLQIPKSWKNPSGDWHLGTKILYELYRKDIKDRINPSIIEDFKKKNKSVIAKELKELNDHEKKVGSKSKKILDKEDREEINTKLEYLKEAEKLEIQSPILDCIVWNDGEKWKAAIDTTYIGNLEDAKVMSSFCTDKEYGFISDKCLLTYCLNIHEDGNLLEICVPNGSHGSHVAHIAAGHFPDDPEKDGLAPGAQIISLGLGNAYTEQAFIRAFNKCIELKVDIINLSSDTPSNCVGSGKTEKLIKNVVEKYGIIFVAAAGNDGPGLSVAGFAGGRIHSSIFYVGAYLTAEMKEAMYSHFEADNSVVFPFSSRGPSVDGSLGVTFCAPGAALTGVSKHCLEGMQRKQGTSMSSPNAVGNIACLLSAMKDESIPISPFRIKLALQNSAMMPEDGSHHPFSLGAGIIQISSAFELIKSAAFLSIPPNITDIRINVGSKKLGIYLRDPSEIASPQAVIMDVKPLFMESGDNEARVDFGCSIMLKLASGSEKDFVKFPKYCRLPSSDFSVIVDPTKLEVGKVHYAEIVGINPQKQSLGPLFRIPITVIIPEEVTSENLYRYKKQLILEPAVPERIFIKSPFGCKYVGIKIKSLESQIAQNIRIQQIFLNQKIRCRLAKSYQRLLPKDLVFCHFISPENQTIEYCFTQEWSNQNVTNIKITIQFFGILVQPQVLFSVNPTNKICFTNYLSNATFEPILEFKSFCQPLTPSEAIIESMEERDIIDGNPSFRLLLTYKFHVTKSELYKFEYEGTQFYKIHFDSYLLQLFTVSKKHIYTCGDNGHMKNLEIGDYIIRAQFRHSDPQILETLKDARLIATQTIIPEIVASLYFNAESALKESGEKIKKNILKCGESNAFYVASIPSYKYPYTYPAGSYLMGKISMHPKETYQSKEHSAFNAMYLLAPQKSYLNDKKGRLDLEADKENEKEDLKTTLRDIEISYITRETDAEKAIALFEKLKLEYPNYAPIYSAEIERLSKEKKLPELKKMVEKLLEIIESKKVAEFFGVKSEFSEENLRKKEIMEKKKAAIINALFFQANLVLDSFLKTTIKDIPAIFRNGFEPKKKENSDAKIDNAEKGTVENAEDEKLKILSEKENVSNLITTAENKHFKESSTMETIEKTDNEKIDDEKNESEHSSSDESLIKVEPFVTNSKTKSNSTKSINDNNDKNEINNDNPISAKLEPPPSEVSIEEVEKVFRDYMLFADSTSENARIIQAKYAVAHERYGTALMQLKKIITDKTTTSDYLSTEKAIIELLQKLGWNHLVEEAQKTLLIKHQKFYRSF